MKTRIVKSCSMLLAALFLVSCATMPGATKNSEQSNAENAQQTTAPNSAEREILYQGVLTGAVVGAALGATTGYLLTKDKDMALLGGVVGSAIGGMVGSKVAKGQIQNLKDIKLKDDQLEKLLAKAREYNSTIASYNDNLQQEIIKLEEERQKSARTKMAKKKRKEAEEERAKIASEKLKDAEDKRALLTDAQTERQQLSKTLVAAQRTKYQETLNDLNKEGEKLDGIIQELRRISEPARIG